MTVITITVATTAMTMHEGACGSDRYSLVRSLFLGRHPVQEAQNVISAVHGGQLFGRMEVDVQRPQVGAEVDEKSDARRVSARRREVQRRVTEVICLVGVAPVYKGSYVYTQINLLWYICSYTAGVKQDGGLCMSRREKQSYAVAMLRGLPLELYAYKTCFGSAYIHAAV